MNSALHAVAFTQARDGGAGKVYIDKLLAAGKKRTEALRLLRRRLSDRVFAALLVDERTRSEPAVSTAITSWAA